MHTVLINRSTIKFFSCQVFIYAAGPTFDLITASLQKYHPPLEPEINPTLQVGPYWDGLAFGWLPLVIPPDSHNKVSEVPPK